jgi:hypothetical protein
MSYAFFFVAHYSPMKMERTECSETLAFKLQTPVNKPEESTQQQQNCQD